MGWWVRIMSWVRRFWIRLAARIRVRKSGLEQLRNAVSACEYEDVHVLWEMLREAMTDKKKKKKKRVWRSVHEWARRGGEALVCCTF